ncbi:MAG TPA: hypothetical protein VFU16_04420 [Solirubrobacterales bacterium]|nr:hypothetical protein [Solirubrobacterales bacterium]
MKYTRIVLALLAVLAVSAFTTSAASALTYNSSASPAMLFGSQLGKHKLTVDGQNVECNNGNYEVAAVANGATEIPNVVAAYNNCVAFGFTNATMNMGSCTFKFLTPNVTPAIMAKFSIACKNNANETGSPNNGDIRVFSSVFGSECEVHIESQSEKSTLSFANNTPNMGKVEVDAEITGLVEQNTKDNGLCPLAGIGITNGGTYNGSTALEATGGATIAVS